MVYLVYERISSYEKKKQTNKGDEMWWKDKQTKPESEPRIFFFFPLGLLFKVGKFGKLRREKINKRRFSLLV